MVAVEEAPDPDMIGDTWGAASMRVVDGAFCHTYEKYSWADIHSSEYYGDI